MAATDSLQRFLKAQERDYKTALSEIRSGRKVSHWMWYVFPQVQGLGFSEMARHYGINSKDEAVAYLQHPVLGSRLVEISNALLQAQSNNPTQVLGTPDDLKLKSSMTLFAALPGADTVFQKVLDKFYGGSTDSKTIQMLGQL